MPTIEHAKMSMTSNYFSNSAAQLPLGMFSNGRINGVSDAELQFSNADIANSLPRDNAQLETKYAWDFGEYNMSISKKDRYTDYNQSVISNSLNIPQEQNSEYYENPFKIPSGVLNETNKYKFVYNKSMLSVIDIGQDDNGDKNAFAMLTNNPMTQSLFNPFLAINTIGMMDNVPLLNINPTISTSYTSVKAEAFNYNNSSTYTTSSYTFSLQNNDSISDVSDCTIKTLVKLSEYDNELKMSKLGMARYKWADFMYCKDLGKVSNNLLITLRKFPYPIGDNIFSPLGFGEDSEGGIELAPDIGRMVAWIGADNKLDDIVKFTTAESWKELHAEHQEQDSKEDSTPLGALFSLGNPKYISAFAAGKVGSQNSILGRFTGGMNSAIIGQGSNNGLFDNKGQYEGNAAMNGSHYDNNKVYSKPGSVQDTHIYEGKLQFTHSFRLVFDYELRAYENINPKSAFLDLLGNILSTCYRKGTFWGGSRAILGAPGLGKNNGFKLANALIDGVGEGAGNIAQFIFSGGKDSSQFQAKMQKWGHDFTENAGEALNQVKDFFTGNGGVNVGNMVADIVSGSMKNALGRPQVYAFNSLLSGAPVGLWHVTIGNPRNPILAMGNLIIENTEYQFYGPLGIDDFPSGLKVSVSLKHAKPRDAAEIANMFTAGTSSINFAFIGANSKGTPDMYGFTKQTAKRYGTEDMKALLNSMASVSS